MTDLALMRRILVGIAHEPVLARRAALTSALVCVTRAVSAREAGAYDVARSWLDSARKAVSCVG